MSRIGRQPIPLPQGVDIQQDGNRVKIKGPKGELTHELPESLALQRENGTLQVVRVSDDRFARAQHGLQRTLLANMVKGVSEGFEKIIEIVGIGYRAQMEGTTLVLQVGYSHLVRVEPFPGITLSVEQDPQTRGTLIVVRGIDKQLVGQQAANIRAVRPPDSYKGKGLRYRGEVVRLKPGKQQAGKGKK
mgnify:CR=1 FL=1